MIPLSILLLSLLFTGVVEAVTEYRAIDGKTGQDCLYRQSTAGTEILDCKPYRNGIALVTGEEIWADQNAKHKQVVFDYNDVIKIMADKEHREKLLNQCKAGDAILVQIDKEKDYKIQLLEGQIKNLLDTAETQERLGATEAQINDALQKQLAKLAADLDREKRLSRYKSEAFLLGVVGVVLWVMN